MPYLVLKQAGQPLTGDEIAARVDMNEPAVRNQLRSDPRFVYLENLQWGLAQRQLSPIMQRGYLPLANGSHIPLDDVCEKVHRKFESMGVFSVTASGLLRAVDEMCRLNYESRLSNEVNIYNLRHLIDDASVFFHGTRRLRIASREHDPNGSYLAGYWVERTLNTIGRPCVFQDIAEQFEAFYQDAPREHYHEWLKHYADRIGYRIISLPYNKNNAYVPPGWVAPENEESFDITPRLRLLIRRMTRRHYKDPERAFSRGIFKPHFQEGLLQAQAKGGRIASFVDKLIQLLEKSEQDSSTFISELAEQVKQQKEDEARDINEAGLHTQLEYLLTTPHKDSILQRITALTKPKSEAV